MSNLSDAPIEVLHLILYYIDQQSDLYHCALVNKSLYAATNPLLWREPKLLAYGTKRMDCISFWLLRSFRQARLHGLHATSLGHYIRILFIEICTPLQDMRQVINNIPLVEDLVIQLPNLNDKDIECIALKCPKLKRLSLKFFNNDTPDHSLDSLRHCTTLRELSIKTSFRTTRLLTSLNHDRLEKLRLNTLGLPKHISLGLTFSNISTLTHLDLNTLAAAYFRHYRTLPSPTFFPGLANLRISMLYGAATDNEAVVSFFKAHPLIDTLTIRSMKIDSAIMTSLATDLVHLKRLTLIHNGRPPPFHMALPLVENLTIRRCSINVPSTVCMATQFPNLHYIHVSKQYHSLLRKSSNIMSDNSQSDRLTLKSLTQLTYLDFASYDSVPGDLKVHLPRRTDGKLVYQDLEHIRKTAVGLAWID
ncbi:hypothetical protein [Absidia glauca]|uniref:F-box domain-containing protein n=1 Tax=Absidia glauca TaxID=4829 RepID=A0A163J7R8_ABSGL|nr:hypothetical protein [Absidia glauca]